MKKTVFKACTALLVLVMVLQLALPQMAILANAASQSGTCGANVSWEFDDSTGKLTISGTGDMDDYSYENPAPWSVGTEGRDQRALKTVVIQKGVTSIGSYAFASASNLTGVSIPDGVTTIGKYAFQGCVRLADVTMPTSLKTIGDSAFSGCESFRNLIIPDSVTTIGEMAFSFSWVQSVSLSKNVKKLSSGVFAYCGYLASIKIPEGVTEIDDHAFVACSHMINVTIPSTVKRIGQYAFLSCGRTKTVAFSGNAPQINADAFTGMTATAYYPGGDSTWTKSVLQNYGGTITWKQLQKLPYTDVKASDYFYYAVMWATLHGVAAGTSKTTFSPNATCTRAQAIAFLWRAMGSPEPNSAKNPFKDVKSNQYYYKAVLWAVGEGIVAGTSDTTFSPNATCTRAQVVSFLYRANGKPNTFGNENLTDVPADAYYYKAVSWAVNQGIASGTSATTFSPNAACTRAHVISFLYRDLA